MGCGNVCVTGEYEGLYCVDFSHLYVFHHKENPEMKKLLKDVPVDEKDTDWVYDEIGFMQQMRCLEKTLCKSFQECFPSFRRCAKNMWITYKRRAIMENKAFYIALEDNVWSIAVELIQKEDYLRNLTGIQARYHRLYLAALRDILLGIHGEVCVPMGAWKSSTVRLEKRHGKT